MCLVCVYVCMCHRHSRYRLSQGLFFFKAERGRYSDPVYYITDKKYTNRLFAYSDCARVSWACFDSSPYYILYISPVFDVWSLNDQSRWCFGTGQSSSVADTQLWQGVHDQHTNSANLKRCWSSNVKVHVCRLWMKLICNWHTALAQRRPWSTHIWCTFIIGVWYIALWQ